MVVFKEFNDGDKQPANNQRDNHLSILLAVQMIQSLLSVWFALLILSITLTASVQQ